jgi:rhamnosyltransferase
VTVLLATFNGRRWLPEQLASILDQSGVDVSVIVSDDKSTDGTHEWLVERAAGDSRVSIVEFATASGGAAQNFFRLLSRVAPDTHDLISFADQDDVWHRDKLSRHAALIDQHGFDGVSSNVISFTQAGTRALVRKDFPQRRFDFLTESPGPGCTFLITPKLARLVARELADSASAARSAGFHDSLIYVIARSAGLGWHIASEPSVDYRQHPGNVLGSNVGVAPALRRLRMIRAGWHRREALLHASIGLRVASTDLRADLDSMRALLSGTGARTRLALAARAGQLRRRPRDRWIIGLLIAIGIW